MVRKAFLGSLIRLFFLNNRQPQWPIISCCDKLERCVEMQIGLSGFFGCYT